MIEIRPGVTFKLWFFGSDESPGRHFDVMGVVQQIDGQPWEMVYRTRSSVDDDPWNDSDNKKWMRCVLKPGANVDDTVANMVRELPAEFPFPVQVTTFDNADHEEIMTWLALQPWAHMKVEGPGVTKGGEA